MNSPQVGGRIGSAEGLGSPDAPSAPAAAAIEPTAVVTPVVSVIINCHNYAQFLPAAVDCVLQQTFRDLEVIMIDDGSTDGSADTAAQLIAGDRSGIPLQLLRLADVGPSAARQAGVAASRGRFILPLDADDKIARTFLERTVPILASDPKLGFVYTDTIYFGDSTQRQHQPEFDFKQLVAGNVIPYCSLIRRAAFDGVGGYDSSNWGYYEHWDLWLRLAEAGWLGRHLSEPLFFYQRHLSTSLSLYSRRLDRLYQAYLVTRHPQLHDAERVTQARRAVAELPAGWHQQPPLRERERIEGLLAQHPENPHLLFFLAAAQSRGGLAQAALVTLGRLVEKHPDDELARQTLAELMQKEQKARAPRGASARRIVALMSAFNEGDVIFHVIRDLIENGLEVYLIDNNSTDNTVAEAGRWLGKGLLKIERFPEEAPGYSARCAREYVWKEILRRKEELASELGAGWYIHVDADEFRESPWPGRTLAEAVHEVDRLGYNAINFELLNFRPTNDDFVPGQDVRQHLTAYEPGELFDSMQIKAWKNTGLPVQIAATAGHSIEFPGRRVFPLNFILRHYPIRGETHGRRKVYQDRLPRFARDEVAQHWHVQYNGFVNGSSKFIYRSEELVPFDGSRVRADLLSRFSTDVMLASMLSRGDPFSGRITVEELKKWVGRKLGLAEPITAEHFAAAEQVLTTLLHLHRATKRGPQPQISPPMAMLLLAVLEARLVLARLNGNSYLATVGARVTHMLQRCAAATPISPAAGAPRAAERALVNAA